MAKVILTISLFKKIRKNFGDGETNTILNLLSSLEHNPKKGKYLGSVGDIALKEIKYKKFHFYFIANNYKIKFMSVEELQNIFIKFVEISEKNNQQHVINKIKHILRSLGEEGFT